MSPKSLTRRDFLQFSALTFSGACLAACGLRESPGTGGMENYYLRHQAQIHKDFDSILKYVRKVAAQTYDATLAEQLSNETEQGFVELLGQLPDIGGTANDLTQNLYLSAGALAFYRAMLAHGKSVEETGKILYLAVEAQVAGDALAGMLGRVANSKLAQEKAKKEGELSQERRYPQDWVFQVVPGDGNSFDWGVDYTECGICKLLKAHRAEELTPYLCLQDFPISKAMGTGLVRTQTLARGGNCCDFRFKTGRAIQMEWKPDFLE